MDLVLKIITFGLYGLFSKSRKLKQKVTKVKYDEDGSIKKKIDRVTEFDEGESEEIPSES